MGVSADADAAGAFRRTAAALASAPPDTLEQRATAANAAIALVHLALAGDRAQLASLLTPDPRDADVVWTVACYQIGGLIPSAVRDFQDPVEAVAVLAACPDEDHVAAELTASTAGGLRWTALARTNDLVVFNLPDAATAADASHEHPTELSRALAVWRTRLEAWGHGRSEPWAQLTDVTPPAPEATWERWPEPEEHAPPAPLAPPSLPTPPALSAAEVGELVRSAVHLSALDLRESLRSDLAQVGRALRADLAATEARLTCHLDRLLTEVHLQASLSTRPASPGGSPGPTAVDTDLVAKSIRAELELAEARLAAGLSRSWG